MSRDYLNLGVSSSMVSNTTSYYCDSSTTAPHWSEIWYNPNYYQNYPQPQVNIQTIIKEKEVTKEGKMEMRGQDIHGSGLVGEVKCSQQYPNMKLVEEVKELMEKYKVDWMWFGWSKFGEANNKE